MSEHKAKVVAVVLTRNEELHLERCLASLEGVADDIVVVDCFSTDATLEIAREHGATVVQREWINHATQFNFALTLLPADVTWVLRIDADEYLTPELAREIRVTVPELGSEVDGVFLRRSIVFQGRKIRFGGMFPARILRLFRFGRGRCESRWMDEHLLVDGGTVEFHGEIIDENLNPLTWWIDKHNRYASLEAIELLDDKYGLLENDPDRRTHYSSHTGAKRWFKDNLYGRMPSGVRAFAYFAYRYVVRLGFLDGKAGLAFHLLQGLWYRYLVDAKVSEVQRLVSLSGMDARAAVRFALGVDLDHVGGRGESEQLERANER